MSYIDVGVYRDAVSLYTKLALFSTRVLFKGGWRQLFRQQTTTPTSPQFYSWQQQEEQKKEKEKDGSSFILLCIETERSFFLNDYFLILCVCVCVCSVEEKKETESGWFSLDCIW